MQAMHLKCGLGLKTWEPIKIETQRRGACIFVFFAKTKVGHTTLNNLDFNQHHLFSSIKVSFSSISSPFNLTLVSIIS